MPLPQNLRQTRTGWSIRVRIGAAGRPWLPMPEMSETDALSRLERVQALAEEFVRAKKPHDAERALRTCAEQPTPKAFDVAVRAAKRRLTELGVEQVTAPKTFKEVAELWTSGDLHRAYPDDVPSKTDQSRASDRAMLAVFFPRLGHLPMPAITAEDTEAAKRLVPTTVGYATRRNYLIRLRTVCKLAQHPLALIDALPLRGKFVPPVRVDRDFWYLYPEEEQRILACAAIPLEFRLLYGFIVRNGTRITETLRITWAHIDWDKGVLRLDKSWTKTRRGRVWKLDPDVLRALRRRWTDVGKPKGGLIFTGASGEANTRLGVQRRFTSDLRAAGITRTELLVSTPDARRLRVHDLRATFVTLARKVGRRMADGVEIVMTDRWIMDRTGHETLGVLGKYERLVRQAAELDLGWFAPLDETLWPAVGPAVARTKGGPKVDQRPTNTERMAASNSSSWTGSSSSGLSDEPNLAAASRSVNTGQRLGPPQTGGVDQKPEVDRTAVVTSRGRAEAPSQVDQVSSKGPAPRRSKQVPAETRAHSPEVSTGGGEEARMPGLSEATLRRLLELATRSKEWGVVRELSAALETLAAREAPNVTSLDSRRRR